MTRRRCACRPGCLTWLHISDDTVHTAAGEALATHVAVQPYPDALREQDAEALNEVAS